MLFLPLYNVPQLKQWPWPGVKKKKRKAGSQMTWITTATGGEKLARFLFVFIRAGVFNERTRRIIEWRLHRYVTWFSPVRSEVWLSLLPQRMFAYPCVLCPCKFHLTYTFVSFYPLSIYILRRLESPNCPKVWMNCVYSSSYVVLKNLNLKHK